MDSSHQEVLIHVKNAMDVLHDHPSQELFEIQVLRILINPPFENQSKRRLKDGKIHYLKDSRPDFRKLGSYVGAQSAYIGLPLRLYPIRLNFVRRPRTTRLEILLQS